MIYFLTVLMLVGGVLSLSESWVVEVEQGPVRGYKHESGDLYRFLNIPYATAPTGEDKYKAPLPPPQWTEPYEFTEKVITCIQPIPDFLPPFVTNMALVQEDCLVANIYVPETNNTDISVLVVVHGGAYQSGVGIFNEYNSLVRSEQVIVVTFNYRLGLPGFLCLGTEDIPGNAGMKDQVALLRWVNRNIARFGGNPNDVTITGCSAGGGSVDFLTVSPMTKGLFNKAITESGGVLGCVGPQVDPVENARIYAKKLNFNDVDDIHALEQFYKTASYDLLLSESDFIMYQDDTLFLFTPCVERETGEERFLDDTPVNIIKSGKYHNVPLMYGYAEMEGLIRMPDFDILKSRMNTKFSDFLPAELKFESEAQKDEIGERVKQFYFGDADVSEETILAYVDYFTDAMFAYPMLRGANLRRASLADTIYLYEYSFVDEMTDLVPHTNVRGANHCSQMMAVMDDTVIASFLVPINHTEEYLVLREQMREMWLSFIKTGNPTPAGNSDLPSWPAVNGVNAPFMNIDATMALENTSLLEERVKFWDSIYEEYYRAPVPPADPNSSLSLTAPTMLIAFLYVFYVFS